MVRPLEHPGQFGRFETERDAARQFLGDQLGEAAVPGTDIDVTPDPFNRVSAIEAGRSVDPQEILNDCDGAAHDPRHPAAKIDAFSGVKACRRIAGGAIDAVGVPNSVEIKMFRKRSTWSIWDEFGERDHPDLEISSRDDHRSKNEPKRPHFERARRVSRSLGPTRTSGWFPHRSYCMRATSANTRDLSGKKNDSEFVVRSVMCPLRDPMLFSGAGQHS